MVNVLVCLVEGIFGVRDVIILEKVVLKFMLVMVVVVR